VRVSAAALRGVKFDRPYREHPTAGVIGLHVAIYGFDERGYKIGKPRPWWWLPRGQEQQMPAKASRSWNGGTIGEPQEAPEERLMRCAGLGPQEAEVWRMQQQGASHAEIAAVLRLSGAQVRRRVTTGNAKLIAYAVAVRELGG
jgi:DNA-binding CsgD family transcriptional regulator